MNVLRAISTKCKFHIRKKNCWKQPSELLLYCYWINTVVVVVTSLLLLSRSDFNQIKFKTAFEVIKTFFLSVFNENIKLNNSIIDKKKKNRYSSKRKANRTIYELNSVYKRLCFRVAKNQTERKNRRTLEIIREKNRKLETLCNLKKTYCVEHSKKYIIKYLRPR